MIEHRIIKENSKRKIELDFNLGEYTREKGIPCKVIKNDYRDGIIHISDCMLYKISICSDNPKLRGSGQKLKEFKYSWVMDNAILEIILYLDDELQSHPLLNHLTPYVKIDLIY